MKSGMRTQNSSSQKPSQSISDLLDNSWWEEKLKEAMNQIPEPCPDCGNQLEFRYMEHDPFGPKIEKDEYGNEFRVLDRIQVYRCHHCNKKYGKRIECERVDVADQRMRQRCRSEWYEENRRLINFRSMFGKVTRPPARYRDLPGYWDLSDGEKLALGSAWEEPTTRAKVSGSVEIKEQLWKKEGIYGD